MRSIQRHLIGALTLLATQSFTSAQDCDQLEIKHLSDINSACGNITMTMLHDQNDRDILYVANKSLGLTIYDISNPEEPFGLDTLFTKDLENLDVMNLCQQDNFLYLALGNHFTNPQEGGMAIIDVTNPANAVFKDTYKIPNSGSGAGIVKVVDDLAYLGGMKSGLVILDVSDRSSIKEVSIFVPTLDYPVKNPNADLYNARGMEVRDQIVYLCYDAGGLRIIDCSDPSNPVETGRYANPTSFQPINRPRAYNNIVLEDSLAFISVDYCGLEVLNISDTGHIKLHGWWNPYGCPENNWFSSPSHTNELSYDKECKKLFVSTGKSDLVILDMQDPSKPDSCNAYGGVGNNIGTWGVSTYGDHIYLSYICAIIPFPSNWSGVKILDRTRCETGHVDPNNMSQTKCISKSGV